MVAFNTVEEARNAGCCRICGESISGVGCPVGWTEEFGRMVYPLRITLDFGKEFAHTDCLEAKGEDDKRDTSLL